MVRCRKMNYLWSAAGIMAHCWNYGSLQERLWFTAGISLKIWLFARIMVLCRNKVICQLKTLKNNQRVIVGL